MKKSELQSIIREEIQNILKEKKSDYFKRRSGSKPKGNDYFKGRKKMEEAEKAEETPKEDPTLASLQKKIDDLSKASKKVPDELKSKLTKKIKTAQSDIDTYKDSLKPKKDEK